MTVYDDKFDDIPVYKVFDFLMSTNRPYGSVLNFLSKYGDNELTCIFNESTCSPRLFCAECVKSLSFAETSELYRFVNLADVDLAMHMCWQLQKSRCSDQVKKLFSPLAKKYAYIRHPYSHNAISNVIAFDDMLMSKGVINTAKQVKERFFTLIGIELRNSLYIDRIFQRDFFDSAEPGVQNTMLSLIERHMVGSESKRLIRQLMSKNEPGKIVVYVYKILSANSYYSQYFERILLNDITDMIHKSNSYAELAINLQISGQSIDENVILYLISKSKHQMVYDLLKSGRCVLDDDFPIDIAIKMAAKLK